MVEKLGTARVSIIVSISPFLFVNSGRNTCNNFKKFMFDIKNQKGWLNHETLFIESMDRVKV